MTLIHRYFFLLILDEYREERYDMLKRLKNIFHTSNSENTSPSKKQLYQDQTPLNDWKLVKELGDGAFGESLSSI